MPNHYSTPKLALKAFKEIVSCSPTEAILYPITKNLMSILEVYSILVMGHLLDSIGKLLTQGTPLDFEILITTDTFTNFSILIAIAFFRALFTKLSDYFQSSMIDLSWMDFQQKSMNKMSQLNLEDIEQKDIQNLLTNVPTYSQSAVWDTYLRITDLGYYLILFFSSAYIIATQMAPWGLIVIGFVLPEAIIRYRHNVKFKEHIDVDAERMKYFEYLYRQSMFIRNFPELRVDNVFSFFTNSFKNSATQYYKKLNEIRFTREFWSFLSGWIGGSLKLLMQLLLVPVAIVDKYTIGTFKYLFDYIENLYSSSWNALWNIFMIKTNCLYVKDYFDLFEYQGFGDVASGTEKLDSLSVPKIEFVNVSFSYPDSSSSALENVSFTIKPGENIAIIGRDNSGKSTIAKLLCGLYQVGPGDILIDDVSIKNLSRGELKSKISVVFEDFIKYNFSIRKNIVVTQPERDFSRRLYEEALEITELDTWMKENKIDDHNILGKLFGKGLEISTGHWQRVAIARALYRDRSILILDESMTQIDSFSRRPIIENIIKHRPKQTFIHITQEVADKDLFDTLIYIENGKVSKIETKKKK